MAGGVFEMGDEGGSNIEISLTPALEKFVENLVVSGQYDGASEVLCGALGLLMRRDFAGHDYDDWLSAQIEIGVHQADQGELEDHDMGSIAGAIRSATRT